MTLSTQGEISFSEMQAEFGGSNPISFSEYYRGGSKVPTSSTTTGISSSGSISVDQFHAKRKALDVTYEMIGAGGGGGSGTGDRPSPSCVTTEGIAGYAGTASYIKQGTTTLKTANGGTGGVGRCASWVTNRNYFGTDGEASYYGAGGAKGLENQNGSNAPSTSYGAGGGGAGGDDYSTFDEPGYPGAGGDAGTRLTGTLVVDHGTTLSLITGNKGAGGNSTYDGGAGAGGYVKLTYTAYSGGVTSTNAANNTTTTHTVSW
jgi:hypothetical protein